MTAGTQWGAAFAAAGDGGMRVYDEVFVPRLFEPWARLLLDRLAVAPGESLLDVATGPGTLARLAAVRLGPAGRVTAADISPAMIAIARAKPADDGAAPITYVESPAGALAVPDATFDVVTCQQGLQFFPDQAAALGELRRAARDGARLGIAVWSAIEESPFFAALADAVEQVLGADAAAQYRGGPWGMRDGAVIGALAEAAGFADVRVGAESLPVTFDGGPAMVVATLAAAPVAELVAALDADGRAALETAAAATLAPFTENGAVRSHATSHVVTAVAA